MNLRSYTFPIRDKDRAAAADKPQDKTKKPTGEKRDRTTTNIDEAAIIAIAPKEFKISSILLWQAQRQRPNAELTANGKAQVDEKHWEQPYFAPPDGRAIDITLGRRLRARNR